MKNILLLSLIFTSSSLLSMQQPDYARAGRVSKQADVVLDAIHNNTLEEPAVYIKSTLGDLFDTKLIALPNKKGAVVINLRIGDTIHVTIRGRKLLEHTISKEDPDSIDLIINSPGKAIIKSSN